MQPATSGLGQPPMTRTTVPRLAAAVEVPTTAYDTAEG
jgi:hypothetical protein